MRTPSGILHVVDFKTEQIVANIQPKDYWDDIRHWEIKNNVDTLEFKVFDNTEHAATLIQQNLVLKEVRDGRIVPYVITEAEKDSHDRSVIAYASGEWIQLAKAGIIPPQKLEGKTVMEMVNIALSGTKWKAGNIEYASFRSMTIDEFIDPLSFLKKIASLFELEIQYRAEVVGSQIISRYVDMVKKRGQETGKEVTLGKDLIGIKRVENSQNICTSLVGFVKKEGDTIITVESINNGLPYIVDNDAFQRWNERGQHKFGFYTPETEEDITPQRLMTLMKTELAKRVNTSVVYEVQAQSIGRVFGLAHELINEGDTIRIKDTGFTPKLYLEARAIAGDESFTDPSQDKYVFGDYREIVDPNEELRKLYNKVLVSLGNKANKDLLEQLEKLAEEAKKQSEQAVSESQVAKDIAEATKEYMDQNLVDIIEAVNPPTTGLKTNKTLWRDISNGKPGILKIWTGTAWESVVPDTGSLQQSIQDAENEINTLKESVKDLPDTTWVNQQLEGKADKSGVYTKDYIDQNLVGKQIYETDKQGNIQKFTDMKTEIDQNAEAITQKAEKTQVDTISNNLALVTQTANTAKQTADSNTNTITSLQTTVSNLNDNVTNLLIDSGTFEGAKTTAPSATDRWWFKNNGLVRLSTDTYQGNAVIETQTAWNSLAYNFKDLVSRGVVKAGDKVNYSVCVRVKNLANGQSAQQNFYFRTGATGIRPPNATNQWQRVSVSFIVTPDMMTVTGTSTDSFMRIEPDTAQTGAIWYQQSTPQLTIGEKVYTWRPAPEDNATFIKKSNEIKQTVDSNVATIQSIQKDQGTMQSTLNEVKQTTDSNSQTIKTLSQTQGEQGTIIQQNTSDISQLNNQIKSKVSDTQMQEYVGGLGSTNLLFNAAFEDRVINASTGAVTSRTPSTTKWSVVGTGSGITIVPESARHHEGYNSVKITATGQTASKWSGIMQRVPAVQNGGDYVFSAWVYVQDKNTLDNGGAIKLQFFNGANAVSTFVQTEFKDLLVNNSWVLVSVKITSPNVAITHLQGDIWVRQNGTIWVSQLQLQQGSTRSTFMENPKDYANYDQLVGEIAKKVATSDFNSKVSTLETSINQQSNRIDLKAEKTDVYNKVDSDGRYGSKAMVEKHESSITLMSNEINLTVKKGDIISSINQTAEEIQIDVSKLSINADTVVKWLTAQGIDANVIKISGDVVTIDKSGITVRMANFLYEDEFGKKYSVMPKKNLIADHMFSSISCYLPTNNMRKIQHSPEWRITGEPYIEDNYTDFGYEQMINAMRINVQHWIRYPLFSGVKRGKKYTLSAHFRAATYNGNVVSDYPRLRVITGHYAPDGRPVEDLRFEKAYDAPGRNIVRYSNTFTIPDNFPDNGFCYFDIYGAGDYASNMAVCVSGVQLVEGELPAVYNWDTTIDNIASGYTPVQSLSIGNRDTFLGYGVTSPEFRISTNADVSFNRKISTYGVNVGGQPFGSYGSIFYANGASGWSYYTMGVDGNWKTWNGI
ncbi:phage tail spike protein [Bacillus cereus]|uniref:phage tail spike protein n=1 Tax=Bacillus cereus TaxID=1396 RepID=UPI003D6624F4